MNNLSIPLERYRSRIRLDTPFDRQDVIDGWSIRVSMQRIMERLHDLGYIDHIAKNEENWRDVLYSFIISRPPAELPMDLIGEIDMILQFELSQQSTTMINQLQPVSKLLQADLSGLGNQIYLWKGDITTLEVDAIVNAANSRMLGCFVPHHRCIDNAIHARSGPQLRDDCNMIMDIQGSQERTGDAKITRAYNLPSKYVIHTVGPIFDGKTSDVSNLMKEQLESSYLSCLVLANQVEEISSLAFCSISTGVFGFPIQEACMIAIDTVIGWLKDNGSPLQVVFNVFSQSDHDIYKRALMDTSR